MRLPDVNVLVYAHNTDAAEHDRARRWLEAALIGPEPIAFAWVALLGFIRISTRLAQPMAPGEAFDIVDELTMRPNAEIVHPTRRHRTVLRSLLEPQGVAGNLTTDAHLATLAIEHGATLASFDADFHRWPELRFEYLR